MSPSLRLLDLWDINRGLPATPLACRRPNNLLLFRVFLTALAAMQFLFLVSLPVYALPPLKLDAPRNYVTHFIPLQVLPMDLDGDKDHDAAVLSVDTLGNAYLELFENPGDGTLTHRTSLSLPASTELVQSDLNGDGRLDLLQARSYNTIQGRVLILTQSGSFSFNSQTLSLSFPASHLCVGNLDGINGPDLVIGDDLASPLVHVYLSNGLGSYSFQGTYSTEMTFRDVDGDGLDDAQTPIDVLHCLCRDLNGDNRADLVLTNSIQRVLSHDVNPQCQAYGGCIAKCPTDPADPKYEECRNNCYSLHSPPACVLHVSNVVALLNRGDGTLGPFHVLLESFGQKLGISDMDGNGSPDIVTTGTSLTGPDMDDVILIRNVGNGTFFTPRRFASGSGEGNAGALALADVDGDGDMDVGVVHYGPLAGNVNDEPTDHWALLKNNGMGELSAPSVYPAGADVLDLAFADLDGFAGPEALTVAGDDNRLSVQYNEGGQYPTPAIISIDNPKYAPSGGTPEDIASGDFNNDGWMDLAAVVGYSSLTGPDTLVILNGITGGVSSTPVIIDLPQEMPVKIHADRIAGNSAYDLGVAFIGDSLFGKPMGVGLSLGVIGAQPAPMKFVSLNGMPSDLTALDVNSDGIKDMAVLRIREEGLTAGISILTVAGDGTMTYVGDLILGSDNVMEFDARLPQALCSADMNRDGLQDLIAVTWNSLGASNRIVTVFLNHGNLTFTRVGEFMTASREVKDVIGADVTGDDLPDVILTTVASLTDADQDGSLEVLVNRGGGSLGSSTAYNVGRSPVRVAAAQMDGAQGLDLVVANDGSNEITLLLNDGYGRFPVQERYLSGGGTDGLTLADLDHDGDADVAVCNDNHTIDNHLGTVSILTNRLGARQTKSFRLAPILGLLLK